MTDPVSDPVSDPLSDMAPNMPPPRRPSQSGDPTLERPESGCLRLERLKLRRQFLRVASRGEKWVTPGVIMQAAPRPTPQPAQEAGVAPVDGPVDGPVEGPVAGLGFTCSKKVGNAVARNRARRRLREAARRVLPEAALPGRDYVLIGRPETLERPFAKLVSDLHIALARLGAHRDPPDLPPARHRPAKAAPRRDGGRADGRDGGRGAGGRIRGGR
ncbi:ribonuclease P protein component [Roseospirillum parvum]|uniref:Ribonuclease P protein component n=1 Tax=Roseospirillum parvum TaxID=83401 RepID=A0A1G7WQF6_9PROT|nr:ribonuclease P protein component [Roseospirillum parvum]SDG74191.1 ribonuclease P protein component [Roseospirillum parvum]